MDNGVPDPVRMDRASSDIDDQFFDIFFGIKFLQPDGAGQISFRGRDAAIAGAGAYGHGRGHGAGGFFKVLGKCFMTDHTRLGHLVGNGAFYCKDVLSGLAGNE